MLTQYEDSDPMNEKILKAIKIECKGKSLRPFLENYIRFSGIFQQRFGNVFNFDNKESEILKESRTESNFVLKSVTKMGCWHQQGDLSPWVIGLEQRYQQNKTSAALYINAYRY